MIALVACCSPEYLSRYKVLYDSILKYVPNATPLLYYGGIDHPSGYGQVINVHHWVEASQYTNPFFTYCSIRPKSVLDAFNMGYDKVILLGADTEFFSYPQAMIKALDTNDAAVTMYTHEPYPCDSLFANDFQVWINGQINADFIGFKKSVKVINFLEWVVKQTSTKCQVGNITMVDQGYFSMCFSFLDNVKVIRELGYNVGSYNGIPRGMKLENKKWLMKDGSPLVLYHYDGFVKGQEHLISKHQSRYTATGDLLKFLVDYGRKI